MLPTSLLAMVDASIGGKTGVNVPSGKNMLGCLYQPKKVFIDPMTLQTLGKRELKDGFVEMIKHGLVADSDYFCFLEEQAHNMSDLKILEKAIFESCLIKKEIVEEDEKEKGKRHLLNFGHTVGHALERETHYELSHGEAVAIGLLVESYLAVQLGYLHASSFERIKNIMRAYAIPLDLPSNISLLALIECMKGDKKSKNGRPRFVLLNEIGSSLSFLEAYCDHVEDSLLQNALEWMKDDLCCH